MCGLAGYIGDRPILFDEIKVLKLLNHRGPDSNASTKISINNVNVWLGHTRLKILDLTAAGKQPMQSKDGRWWVIYNGEIYNHLQIRRELKQCFNGHSDTETLVESFAQFGLSRTLDQLNGMYAFAALDLFKKKLYLVRDPFGIKPLYYTVHNDLGIIFASEIRAIKAISQKSYKTSVNGLKEYMTLRYIPSPKTMWEGIYRIPPGHVLCYDLISRSHKRWRFIKPSEERFKGSLKEASASYREILNKAVQRQLLSDVPVGIMLSGGIDSALVASFAKCEKQDITAFTVGFQDDSHECEINDSRETAHLLGLQHKVIRVTANQLKNIMPKVISSVEEPLGTTSILPMWYLTQYASDFVKVVLTGQGSDEPWGGYRRYKIEIIRRLLPFLSDFKHFYCLKKLWPGMPEVIERGLRTLPIKDTASRFSEAYALFNAQERQSLLGDCEDGGAIDDINYWLEWLPREGLLTVEQMMRIDTRMNLADDLLLYGDKIAMAASLEARVPMLDLELVRFVESLPLHYRLNLFKTKTVHKMMARDYLSPSIINRKKKGFLVPFGNWSRSEWRDWIESELLDLNAPHLSFLNRSAIENIWASHLVKKPDCSRQIFALLNLAIWFKND